MPLGPPDMATPLDDKTKRRIKKLAAAGYTPTEISKRTGVCKVTIWRTVSWKPRLVEPSKKKPRKARRCPTCGAMITERKCRACPLAKKLGIELGLGDLLSN